MVSKEDIIIYGLPIFLIIIMVLGQMGVFEAQMPGEGLKCNLPSAVCSFGTAIGFPEEWLNTKTFLWYSIIPILGMWLIIYGFLDRIKIFWKTSLNMALSFLIAFSTVPLGIFILIVSTIFAIMGVYSVVLFVILFFIGTGFFTRALWRGWKGGMIEKEMGIYQLELGRVRDELNITRKELEKTRAEADEWRRKYQRGEATWEQTQKEIAELTKKTSRLEARYRGLQTKYNQLKKQKSRTKKELKKKPI
jgi:hypothetical protein